MASLGVLFGGGFIWWGQEGRGGKGLIEKGEEEKQSYGLKNKPTVKIAIIDI